MKYNLITVPGAHCHRKNRNSRSSCRTNQRRNNFCRFTSRFTAEWIWGPGKDYEDYFVDGIEIPAHLVDIEDAGEHYNVYRFQTDFIKVFDDIRSRNKFPVLCGGSGLYIEAVLKNYRLTEVPPNKELRKELEGKNLEELTGILKSFKPDLHNSTDVETDRRAIRAIEIEKYYAEHSQPGLLFPRN